MLTFVQWSSTVLGSGFSDVVLKKFKRDSPWAMAQPAVRRKELSFTEDCSLQRIERCVGSSLERFLIWSKLIRGVTRSSNKTPVVHIHAFRLPWHHTRRGWTMRGRRDKGEVGDERIFNPRNKTSSFLPISRHSLSSRYVASSRRWHVGSGCLPSRSRRDSSRPDRRRPSRRPRPPRLSLRGSPSTGTSLLLPARSGDDGRCDRGANARRETSDTSFCPFLRPNSPQQRQR